jgi:RNA polymerase sigma factor (sigma-70 family)
MRGEIDLEQCVNEHSAALYRFALSLSGNESDACDLVQDTFLLLTTKGHQVNDPARIKSWLFTTLYRVFTNQRRRLIRFPHRPIDEAEGELPEILAAPPRVDWETLSRCMVKLDEIFRAPVVLFYLEDYSYAEIAQVLGVPLGTVKSRIARGIASLQTMMADQQKNDIRKP